MHSSWPVLNPAEVVRCEICEPAVVFFVSVSRQLFLAALPAQGGTKHMYPVCSHSNLAKQEFSGKGTMLSGFLTLKLMLKPAVNVTTAASNTICGVQLRAGVGLAQQRMVRALHGSSSSSHDW